MNYFKTDGIRGKYPDEINESMLYKIGTAVTMLGYNNILLGYDNRKSSLSLANALSLGVREKYCYIYIIGYTTTPKLEFLSKVNKTVGIMITASHNDDSYNGVKIFICGNKIPKQTEEFISDVIDLNDAYLNYLLDFKTSTNKKIVFDCANGPTSIYTKKLYEDAIICNANLEDEINYNCGCTHPNNIKRLVKKYNADVGFTFDGDGDRVNAISKSGKLIDGDCLCYLLAKYYMSLDLFNPKVVLTKMANNGIVNAFRKIGVTVYFSDVGDKNVYKMMIDNNIMLGSEASGHIINLALDIVGDALLNSLTVVRALETLEITLDDLYNEIKYVPSILKNYYVENFNVDLSGFSDLDIYIRKSGTENCYRVFIQGENESRLEECINLIDSKTI